MHFLRVGVHLTNVLESLHTFTQDAVLICEAKPISEPGPRIVFANQALLRMTGYTLEEIIGRTPRLFQGPETDRATLAEIRERLKTWRHIRKEALNYRKDGTPYWVDMSIFPVHDQEGRYHYWVSVQRDQTELHEQREALSRERQVNQLQRQFVSMVSHEFRTPLSIIDGNARRIGRHIDPPRPERIGEGVEKIRAAVQRLGELMESLLDGARLEEGKIAFAPCPLHLRDLLAEIIGNHAEVNPGYRIVAELDGLPDRITGDPKLLRQVFSNLLSNAIKYSPDSKTVWVTGESLPSGDAKIVVEDRGIGIPEQELAKLFERFFRASTSTGIAGSGIGLHLARQFVELHGGSIEARSTVGEGSSFSVTLPKACREQNTAKSQPVAMLALGP